MATRAVARTLKLTARDSKDGNEEGLKGGNNDGSLGDGQNSGGAVVRAVCEGNEEGNSEGAS